MTPEAYMLWRSTWLGATTERLEQAAVFELTGPLKGRRVLDVGCADGTYAIGAASRGALAVGIDASSDMLRAARGRACDVNVRVELTQADVRRLPFGSNTFDVVLAVTVLCFVSDATAAVTELARVLRPEGRLVIGELGRMSTWAAWRRIKSRLGSETWRHARFWAPSELSALVQTAGLARDRVRGCVYYPPLTSVARLLAPLDAAVGRATTKGAAFLAVSATKEHRSAS